jgi:glutathione synthase/RimK-type ligase-like ATP-grasp enzyme
MRFPRRVGVAASSEFPELDAGWPALRAALMAAGLDPVVVAWDRESAGGGNLDLVIVNYCWGYVTRLSAFLAWAERTAARSLVMNPVPALRWNSDKAYLSDLAAAGVPTVPTTFIAPGEPWSPPAGDYVIKPSVGSGGWWAARYARGDREAAERHVAALHGAGQTVLLQPYQRSADTTGETAMVFFGGQFSHAVHKAALLEPDRGPADALWEREVITPTAPSARHLQLARAAMATVARRLGETAYARVDVIDGNDGAPAVLEVELVEPSLFLPAAEGAAARFVRVLAGLLGP